MFETQHNRKKPSPKRHEKARPPPRKAVRFQLEDASAQAQNALKAIINDVHKYSKSYKVSFVDPKKGGLELKHLVDVVNGLDLATEGIYCIPPANDNSLPIIKINKVHEMIKGYSDELAAQKERELIAKGSSVAQRAMRLRDRAEKKKAATKVLTVSWAISNSDLGNQKATEIQKRVSKGEHFLLYLGEKKSFTNARQLATKENGFKLRKASDLGDVSEQVLSEMNVEQRKRLKIFSTVKGLLDDNFCQYEVSGDLESRVLLSCQPAEQAEDATGAKAAQREEIKRQNRPAKSATSVKETKTAMTDEELDSLYLFKIE